MGARTPPPIRRHIAFPPASSSRLTPGEVRPAAGRLGRVILMSGVRFRFKCGDFGRHFFIGRAKIGLVATGIPTSLALTWRRPGNSCLGIASLPSAQGRPWLAARLARLGDGGGWFSFSAGSKRHGGRERREVARVVGCNLGGEMLCAGRMPTGKTGPSASRLVLQRPKSAGSRPVARLVPLGGRTCRGWIHGRPSPCRRFFSPRRLLRGRKPQLAFCRIVFFSGKSRTGHLILKWRPARLRRRRPPAPPATSLARRGAASGWADASRPKKARPALAATLPGPCATYPIPVVAALTPGGRERNSRQGGGCEPPHRSQPL